MAGTGYSTIEVDLSIDSDELLKLYRGSARQVVAKARDGRVLQFPALRLQPFVTRLGVHGRFRLIIDEHNKLLHIEQLR